MGKPRIFHEFAKVAKSNGYYLTLEGREKGYLVISLTKLKDPYHKNKNIYHYLFTDLPQSDWNATFQRLINETDVLFKKYYSSGIRAILADEPDD